MSIQQFDWTIFNGVVTLFDVNCFIQKFVCTTLPTYYIIVHVYDDKLNFVGFINNEKHFYLPLPNNELIWKYLDKLLGCTLVSSANKADRHDIAEILLKVTLNTIKPTNQPTYCMFTIILLRFGQLHTYIPNESSKL